MAGFKTQSKRHRELAKLNKRRAKDEKRALRKAERSASAAAAAPPPVSVVAAKPASPTGFGTPAAVPRQPRTLAEAVERWKSTKVTGKTSPR